MKWNDLNLLSNDLPKPFMVDDTRFTGDNGVEEWFAAIIPLAIKVEVELNATRRAQDPPLPTTRNFESAVATGTYASDDDATPIPVRHACFWHSDLHACPATPTRGLPTVSNFNPPGYPNAGSDFECLGENLATVFDARIENAQPGENVYIVSHSSDTVTLNTNKSGPQQILLTNPVGTTRFYIVAG